MKTINFLIPIFITVMANAQIWSSVGTGMNSQVRTLCVYNYELYAGGDFITAGGVSVNGIGKWNGSNWSQVGNGLNFVPQCLQVYCNELYVGGSIGFEKWNGKAWSPVGTGGPSEHIYTMTVFNDALYISGSCIIRRWNGKDWAIIGNANTDIYTMCEYNGELVVGGVFSDINGIPFSRIAKWNETSWTSLGYGILNGSVSSICSYNGELYVSGDFNTSQGNAGNGIMKWNGSSWLSVTPEIGGRLECIDGKLYCMGGKSYQGSDNIAVYDGSNWSGFGIGMNNFVLSVAKYNGDLYAGGLFTMAGGNMVFYIAKWTDINSEKFSMDVANNSIDIFPNPFTSTISISTSNPNFSGAPFSILDIQGRIIYQQEKMSLVQNINLSRLTDGIYFIETTVGAKRIVKKITKQGSR